VLVTGLEPASAAVDPIAYAATVLIRLNDTNVCIADVVLHQTDTIDYFCVFEVTAYHRLLTNFSKNSLGFLPDRFVFGNGDSQRLFVLS